MTVKITEDEYKGRLNTSNLKHGDRDIILSGDYTNLTTKARHTCNKCGYTWSVQPNNLLNGQNCPGCHQNGNTKSVDVLKKRIQDKYDRSGKNIKVVSVLRTNTVQIRLKQIVQVTLNCICGHVWETSYANACSTSGCPKCAGLVSTVEDLIEKLRLKFGDSLAYSKVEAKSLFDTVTVICPKHGDFSSKVIQLLQRKHGCIECAKEKVTKSHLWDTNRFIEEARRVHGEEYNYDSVIYQHSHTPVLVVCKKHGPWSVVPYNHLHSGSGCPSCSTTVSKPHKVFIEILDIKGVNYESNVRGLIGKKELDIYLPDNNAAIEINGSYWHSDLYLPKNYHYDKALACKKIGIRLIQFWDYEIYDKRSIVLSILRNLVGRSKRVFARKLTLCWLDTPVANLWFDAHHMQGRVYGSSKTVALLQGDKILCAAAFGSTRYSKLADWELLRFANHIGYSITGGASRLFKEFQRNFNPTSVLSYADLRYSQGGLYRNLGFVLHHKTPPNYIYTGNNERISRYKAQKHRLKHLLGSDFDPTLSEVENMKLHGYFRVYDAGNLCYLWNRGQEIIKDRASA